MTTYELKTIKDIFDKIPTDRVETCMTELSVLIQQAQATRGLLKSIEEDLSGKEAVIFSEKGCPFPEIVTWQDDGEGKITISININDERKIVVETHLKEVPDDHER